MKTYKTWEMMQHSGKKFKRKSDGFVIEIASDGTLYWDSGHRFLNTNDEWEEVKEPVDFMTAFKAYAQGKTIRVGDDENGRRYKRESNCHLFPAIDIEHGKWYIED